MDIKLLTQSYSRWVILRRWAGFLIDYTLLGLLFFAFVGIDVELGPRDNVLVVYLFTLAGIVFFFLFMETRWGCTPGKWVTRIRVVNETGEYPSLKQTLIRTATRLLELNPFIFGGAVAGLTALLTPHKQRIGDVLARTYVVKSRDLQGGKA